MEYWDLYDRDRNLLEGYNLRGTPQPMGTFHLVVHACIFNSAGQMLIQHRQPYKQGWSDHWDLGVGGSAVQGENTRAAMTREIFEEIGLKADLTDIAPAVILTLDQGGFGGFDDLYVLNMDLDLKELRPQPEEVSELKWVSEDELMQMIDDDTFIPYQKGLISYLFFLASHKSTQTRVDTTVAAPLPEGMYTEER